MSRLRLLITLIAPYWRSREGRRGWLLLITTFVLTSLTTYSSVYFTHWNGDFYNALESRDYDRIIHEVYRFAYILFAMSIISVNRSYFLSWLKVHWREWMTREYTKKWLANNCFYHIKQQRDIENIDQRISVDIKAFIQETTSLFYSFTDAIMTVGSFSVVLWNLSGSLDFEWAGKQFSIQGYLVYGAFCYAIVGFLIAKFVGKRLQFLNWQAEQVEADYRAHLMKITENNEAMAFANAGRKEQSTLATYFSGIFSNTKQRMQVDRNFNLFTMLYGQGMFLPPLFLCLPSYLSGAMDLGGYMQVRLAFAQVVGSVSWFSESYDALMSWFATADRLAQVSAEIDSEEYTKRHVSLNRQQIRMHNIELKTAQGKRILAIKEWRISPGDHCQIKAPSGAGKTTVIKALAGLWPNVSGTIEVPDNLVIISQRDYLPTGTLQEAILYPYDINPSATEMRRALASVNLSGFFNRLAESQNWQQVLSGGERQRLRLVKCFLMKPSWLVLARILHEKW